MRLKSIMKIFSFDETNRSRITLGTKIRLNPQLHRLELEETTAGYSTDADLYAKTWITNPRNVKSWLGFDVTYIHTHDTLGSPYTSLGYRLGDGTDEYWWNGASWEVNTADWNTEDEVAANIADFPITERKMQAIINLVTTDSAYTPVVKDVTVLYASDVEFQEDIIVRSLIPKLKEEIRVISDYPIVLTTDTDTIDLDNDYPLEVPYNITGIDSVYDHTNDPEHFVDLYDSYNVGTKVITLTSVLTTGTAVWIKFVCEPEVALSTDREYTEIDKVPSLQLTNVDITNDREVDTNHGVRNKGAGTAVVMSRPRQRDFEITIRVVTASSRDQQRLADELAHFFATNKQLLSVGLDELYDMDVTRRYTLASDQGQGGVYTGMLKAEVVNTLYYRYETGDAYTVQRFVVIGGNVEAIVE